MTPSSTATEGARRRALKTYAPGVQMIGSYERRWLSKDVVAGLVLSALLVPQGMAYAELAGLPPVTGLYTSILCLLGYAVFGPSRILVLGPDSSLGPMIAATIAPLALAGGDPARAVALASVLALLVGLVMTVAGLTHLGFVADLLSKPTQIGYMNGLALTIIVGQLPKLFGFSVDADGLLEEAKAFLSGLADGAANQTAAVLGIGSLVGILLLQRLLPKIPAVLVAVVLASLAVNFLDLESDGVQTVGVLPQGFPPFTIPTVPWGDLPELFLGAVAIAVVALADTMSTAASFAARRGERVRGDQEMIGIGAANIAAGFFQGFPVSTSGSRTAVSEQAGSRSQITGVVGAAVITFVLVFATALMEYVPQPTLGAIVIAAALSLANLPATKRLWHQRRTEFALSMAALLGVALLGVLPGILIAITLSILNVFRRVWWPHQAELGRVRGLAGLHDTERYPEADLLPGLVIFRFDAPLIFANSRTFDHALRALAEETPDLRWLVIAAEPVTDVDTTASDMLQELDTWLNARGVSLVFAEMKDPVREKIERYELIRTIAPAHFFRTLDEAVDAYVAETGDNVAQPWEPNMTSPENTLSHGGKRRIAAWVALLAAAAAVVYLGVEAVRRWDVLVLSIAALATLVVAAWYVLSRRGGTRWIAAATGVAALVVFSVVVISSESVRVLVVGLVLGALAVGSARVALAPTALPTSDEASAPRPVHPVLLMNLRSGGGKAERFGLVERCHERGIEPIVLTPGDDLMELAEDAVRRGADILGMAGGDGSQALVATVASRRGLPFVVIPAGTRNHFALDLGLDREDVIGALDAYVDGVDRLVDLAEVNGRVFVNNASMGVYAKVVQASEYRDAKVQTTASMLPDLLGPGATPLDLRFTLPNGEERTTANLVLVSNNPYQLSHLRGAGTRPRMDGGRLGVVSVLVRGAADAESSPLSRPRARWRASPASTSGPRPCSRFAPRGP